MDFVTKSFRKDETLTSWTLLQHICPHFWAWLLNTIAITPKSEDKYVVKVFNWSEVHLSEMTCYKIHTLVFYWQKLFKSHNLNLLKPHLFKKQKHFCFSNILLYKNPISLYCKPLVTLKLRVLTHVYNTEINVFPKDHSK